MFVGLLLNAPLHYVVWGISSGRLLHPDNMTVRALGFLALVGLPIVFLPPLILLIVRRLRFHGTPNI
jgi:hypothetical protein